MTKISKAFITWEEFYQIMGAGWSSSTPVDAANVGGLVPGSIPFADASGYLTEDNPALFWDAAEDNLGIGTNMFGTTMTQGIQMKTGLAPTANVPDTFAFYSADFVAGNACPHFRTENGTIIGLNQSLFTTDAPIFASGVIVGNLTLANGSITDSGGAISFGNENLSTTGTFGCGTITVANGSSINLQEDITFTGATTENLIKFPDNLANALSFMEGANPYVTFKTTNGSEAMILAKLLDLTSGQIKFPAAQVPSADANTLDDYEEGTWTMGVSFGGGTTGITYTRNTGYYTRVGQLCFVFGDLVLSNKGTDNGAAFLTGLPFTVINAFAGRTACTMVFNNITFADQFQGYAERNTTSIELFEALGAGGKNTLTDADFANNSQITVGAYFIVA